jgi:hypothetical protein
VTTVAAVRDLGGQRLDPFGVQVSRPAQVDDRADQADHPELRQLGNQFGEAFT